MKQEADSYPLDKDRRIIANAVNGRSAQIVIRKRDAERKRSRMGEGGGVAVEMRRRDQGWISGGDQAGLGRKERAGQCKVPWPIQLKAELGGAKRDEQGGPLAKRKELSHCTGIV
jgi:hypothetical protein